MELNKIYLGDAYELIKQVEDKSVDLIVTDPPYEIVAGGSGGCFGVQHRDYHGEYKKLATDEHKREGLRIIANTRRQRENLNCVCAGFDYSILDELRVRLYNVEQDYKHDNEERAKEPCTELPCSEEEVVEHIKSMTPEQMDELNLEKEREKLDVGDLPCH